jgi:HipA-like protein
VARELDVWLLSDRIGTLTATGAALRFCYTPEWLARADARALSISLTVERVRQSLDTTFPTANAAVGVLEELGILIETSGQKKNRSYSYRAYIELLSQ